METELRGSLRGSKNDYNPNGPRLVGEDSSHERTAMKRALVLCLLLGLSTFAFAGSQYTINFEQYPGYTQITNQYASDMVTFENALQLVAPGYDYFDFPPHSGSGVITNDPGSTLMINFTTAMESVSGWYADPSGITVDAYNSKGTLISSFVGTGVVGSDLQFAVNNTNSGGYISYITITDNGGQPDSFIIDDLSFDVPEPGVLSLIIPGLMGALVMLRRKPLMART